MRDDRSGGIVMAKYPAVADTYDLLTCEAVALQVARAMVARAALSICLHDVDDHPWNMGFLRDADGWRAAPVFDVVPCPDERDGTPLEGTTSERSLEQLLDLDWGLPRSEVLDLTTRVAQVARGAWERARKDFGLDPQDARMCERIIESTCDFDTVLDGREARYAS
ncbi:hypothetical protein DRB07_12905 [Actinomyces sp. Z3]|nr:hypothetical protein DRB07_12905 [Actinomyces sp. Z3]